MAILIVNNTNQVVVLTKIGKTIPASGQVDVNPLWRPDYANSDELLSFLTDRSKSPTGDPEDPTIHTLKINDGLEDLSPLDGLNLLNNTYPKNSEIQPTIMKPIKSSLDHFGNMKTSETFTLFQSSAVSGKQPEIWAEKLTGGGQSTFNQDKAAITLSVGTANGDEAVRQLRAPIQYYKGQMQEIILTNRMSNYPVGVYVEAGFGNSDDGLFFGVEGGVPFVMVRSSVSGSVVDTKVLKNNWNQDKLDGSGPSGVILDNTKVQLGVINFSWLGVNLVDFYYTIDGNNILIHTENFTNKSLTVYMKQAILPLRFVIRNTTAQASSSNIDIICQRVATRGENVQIGRVRSISSGDISTSIDGNYKLITGVRLKSLFKRLSIQPINYNILRTDGDEVIQWRILLNPVITGIVDSDWDDLNGISQKLNKTFSQSTPFDSLYEIDNGYIGPVDKHSTAVSPLAFSSIVSDIFLGCNIDSVQDILALEVCRITGNGTQSVLFNGKFREFI